MNDNMNNGRRNTGTSNNGGGAVACEPQRRESNVIVGVSDSDNDGIVDSTTSFLADGGSDGIPVDSPASISSFRSYLQSSLVIELAICSLILVLSMLVEYSGILTPRQRPIPYQQLQSTGDYVVNQAYNETHSDDTIPTTMLILLSVVLPVITMLLLTAWHNSNASSKVLQLHKVFCSWLVVVGLTIFVTDTIKLYVGYLRPIFYDLCEPSNDFQTCSNNEIQIRLSFPSGHASLSFAGLLLFSMQLEKLYGLSKYQTYRISPQSGQIYTQYVFTAVAGTGFPITTTPINGAIYRLVSLLCYLPMLLALYIASSRIVDNKHFPADVVGGATLGSAVAMLVQSLWFPSGPATVGF